ncbi:FAD-dependent oxidoreductase [Aspergillus affinis]|uniref:FAD-dependent oxidoreductase n=1 Tax=Aspergillus affinis TaxID=1070780 RepID=UPI0022FDD5F0|nr:uncharacterized protein KD926_009141 [Aspergillus affinis]KAI9039671.1 hypothetical protein KD926_009141 [Aspergillus affinis]
MEKPRFKVIIIGGSIAGLTLAHCLELANVDFIVLEKHHDLLATIGGSVGLMPNGYRILDQLGIYHQLQGVACPIRLSALGAHSTAIDRNSDGVSVFTDSRTRFNGDLVVGADGVHSVTRSQMWHVANSVDAGLVTEKEMHVLRAEYVCLFGISRPVDGINPGDQIISCYDNKSILVFPSKDASIGWALIKKLDRGYILPDSALLSNAEVQTMGQAAADLTIYRDVRFRDLWIRTPRYSTTLLQEGLLDTWHYGRIVCVGDSVSKMTPNIAQGANTAIEGAAALANIVRKISRMPEISEDHMNNLLQGYAQNQRKRLRVLHAISRSATRTHTRRNWMTKFIGRYVYPYTPNAASRTFGKIIVEAPFLDYVPLQALCRDGWETPSESPGITQITIICVVLIIIVAYAVSFSLRARSSGI